MPIKVPVTQTGLEASIDAAAKRAGKNLKINLGTSAKSVEGLSQPLGRITGKADQFTKSMEAANARVLAFGASVGVLSSVTRGFQDLVRTTIDVEKRLASINTILNTSTKQLDSFKKTIFDVARNTEQSFATVADAALELSRQGLDAQEVVKRLNDSLILSRLSGLGAAEAVAGLTAAINSFNQEGVTSAQVLNKLSAAAVSAAVSERDLIEGIKRSGSVAIQAGVSFDELVGVITAVQQKTARGGAVIGNSFKTIFTRIQSIDKLQTLQNLGVQITDVSGEILSGTKLIENLAKTLSDVPDARRLQIAENLVGKFQIAPFLAILDDYNSKQSTAIKVTGVSQKATTEAFERNKALNETLAASINATVVSVQELAETLGKIGITDNLKGILDFFGNLVGGLQNILDGDGVGSKFAKGIVKGIGNVLSGPGLAIFGAIIAKLTIDLAKFGVGSLKTFFGLNRAAKEQATLQGQIASTLLSNEGIQKQILAIENSTLTTEQKRKAIRKFFTTALNEQLAVMQRMQSIAATITPGVFAGTRGSRAGRGAFGRGAGGFIPNYTTGIGAGSEQADINRGVGGAPRSAKPVTIPNFNFGAGQKGTMVANTSEFMVPNFAGTGGTAIFNQDMVASLGLPTGAKRVGAAGGFIPNYNKKPQPLFATGKKGKTGAPVIDQRFGMIVPQKFGGVRKGIGTANNGQRFEFNVFGIQPQNAKAKETQQLKDGVKKFALRRANEEALLITGGEPLRKKQDKLANQGGIGSLAGAIFETALSGIIKSPEFDLGQTASFDFLGLNDIRKIGRISPAMRNFPNLAFVEAKIRDNDLDIRNSMANKMARFTTGTQQLLKSGGRELRGAFKEKGVTQFKKSIDQVQRGVGATFRTRGAGGFIPSFAGPLQEAIARETAAGLPINQVRINQDASLRNSANPMGLAVTNTRDEPTGAIPNFRKKSTTSDANDAFGGMVGKLLAVQIGFSALSGVLGEVTEKNKALSFGLTALNVAVSAALAAQAFGGLGKSAGGIASFATGKLGRGIAKSGFEDMVAAEQLGGMRKKGMRGETLRARGKFAGGAALSVVGPLLAAGAAATGIGAAFNALTGKTEVLGKSQERVADSASKAAAVLGGLSADEAAKDRFIDSRAGAGDEMATAFLNRVMTTGLMSEDKEFKNLINAIDTGLKRGAREEDIQGLLNDLKKQAKDEQGLLGKVNFKLFGKGTEGLIDFNVVTIESEKISELSKTISRLGEANLGKRFKEITEGLTEEQRQGLISGDAATIAQVTKQTGQGGNKQLSEDAIKLLAADLKALEAQRDKTAEKEKQQKIDQVNTSLAQSELKTQIELIKLKAEAISRDEITLKRNEFLNNLSEVQKLQIQQRIDLKNIEREVDGQIADQIIEQIDGMEKLTLDSDKQKDLKRELSKLSLDELSSQEKVKEILGDIFDLDGKITGEQKALLEGINKVTSGLRDEEALRKRNLKLSSDIGIADAKRAQDLASAIAAARRENLDVSRIREFDRAGRLGQIQLERGTLNPNLSPIARARAETGFVAREGEIAVQAAEDKAVDETKEAIIELSNEMKNRNLKKEFEGLLEVLKLFGPDVLGPVRERLSTIAEQAFISGEKSDRIPLPDSVFMTQPQKDKLQDEVIEIKQRERSVKGAKDQRDINNALAKSQERVADGFKSYTVLLREFTDSLRQQAEQLKVDLVKARDGSSILSNINEQIFTRQARGGGAGAIAQASTDFAVTALRDQARLAGSGREARGFTRQINIVREQLDLKRQFVELQTNENAKVEDLEALKEKILNLEKQRLTVNDSLRNLLEDEFLFTEEDIQKKLNKNLVSGARQFADTISDGMADAIAKGENLGDILKQAAADFFLQQAKSQFSAGFDRITSTLFRNTGGPVVGGSGARDDVPALLTGGEFVMRKSAVQKFGPRFMEAINSGQIPAFNTGGLFTPGTFGQGAIRGKRDLLNFATQSFTAGQFDRVSGGAGFASIALEPQSAALTMFGRRNSPQFQREQASKKKAFDLFKRQVDREKQARESGSGLSSLLKNSLLAFGVGSLFNMGTQGLGGTKGAPRAIPVNPDGTAMNFLQRLMLPFKRATGGAIPFAAGIDTVPTMLSGGEFVMNAAATQRVGRGTLSSINSGGGGNNGAVIGKLDELISVSENQGETVINITVNSDGTSNESGNGDEGQTNLAVRIRDVVKQVIDDEKRLGGSLREVRT